MRSIVQAIILMLCAVFVLAGQWVFLIPMALILVARRLYGASE